MRWRSTDPRLVIAVPGLCLLALLGTILIMGVSAQPQRHLTFLAGATLIPIAVGLTQRRGHATVAAALTVLATLATAGRRSGVAARPDRRVHELCRVGGRRRDRGPGPPPLPLGLERTVPACLRHPADLRHREHPRPRWTSRRMPRANYRRPCRRRRGRPARARSGASSAPPLDLWRPAHSRAEGRWDERGHVSAAAPRPAR